MSQSLTMVALSLLCGALFAGLILLWRRKGADGGLAVRATAAIEELVHELKKRVTILIVTHNMQQAARVSDYTAYMFLGEMIEFGKTDEIFLKPKDKRTEDYITGRMG